MKGTFSTLRLGLTISLALSALGAGGHASSGPGDPFSGGERWDFTAPMAQPWIPRSLCLVGEDRWIFAAPATANPGVALLGAAEPSGVPMATDWSWAGATGTIEVSSDGSPRGLFALGGFPATGGRRYELRRYDATDSSGLAPVWINDLGTLARVFVEPVAGQLLVQVSEVSGTGVIDVRWLDGATGIELAHTWLSGLGLRSLSVDASGSTVTILAGSQAFVVEPSGLAQTWSTDTVQQVVSIDDAGERLALADLGRVRLFERLSVGATFTSSVDISASGSDMPLRLAWSANSARLAIGWWNPFTTAVRVAVYDTQGVELFSHEQSVVGAQNYPAAIALDAAGERLAIGTWGDLGSDSELWLFDLPTGTALLSVDLGGSVEDLALSPDGTRLVVAQRLQHANQFGTRGAVRVFETGERDLILGTGARLGGTLVARYQQPSSDVGLFVLGLETSAPFSLIGGGLLHVDTARPFLWAWGSRIAPLELEFSLPIPNIPGLGTLPWVLQAATFTPLGLQVAETVLRPRAL